VAPAPVIVQAAPPPPSNRDNDGDGMPDAEDQCPVLPGPVDLGGCPENIQYSPDTGLLTWLTPLHWRSRQAVLDPASRPVLEDLARALSGNRNLHLLIELHVPTKGDAAQSMQLTLDRARALSQWLVANGTERARIEAYGCGSNRPIGALSGRAQGQNERTEVFVVRPLPKQGMPSSLGCQAVELPSE
jgi:OOP family OmpA-OmpF porin